MAFLTQEFIEQHKVCSRCGNTCNEIEDVITWQGKIELLHCLICGDRIDPLILSYRGLSDDEINKLYLDKHWYSDNDNYTKKEHRIKVRDVDEYDFNEDFTLRAKRKAEE